MNNLAKIVIVVFVGLGIYYGTEESKKRQRQREAFEEFEKTRREMGDDFQRNMEKHGVINADTSTKAVDRLRGQLEKFADAGGSEEKEVRAAIEVVSEMQEKAKPYMALIQRIEAENPMDMTTVKDRTDLAARRKFGEEMLRMNSDLVEYIESMESRVRGKLEKAGVSGIKLVKVMSVIMIGLNKSAAIHLRIRKADEKIGKSLIAMTDLLEQQWGKWKVQGGQLFFEDDKALARFNELADATEKAVEEQAAAQREFVDLQRSGGR